MTENTVRLNVFLQQHGAASRRRADELIQLGRVTVNGKVVTELGTKVAPNALVMVDGKPLSGETPTIVLMFHKPDLLITSREDPEGRPTIFDVPALRKLPKNVQPVGRLDFRSEGLLILTNDGNLAYKLTHPKFSVPKTYAVLTSETLVQSDVALLKKGVNLEDGFAKPDSVKLGSRAYLGTPKRGQWVEITISEGRNRIVRRMMEACGLRVVRLVRIAIGDIFLPDDLTNGMARAATKADMKILNAYAQNVEPKPSEGRAVQKKKRVERTEYKEHLEGRSIQLARKQTEREERIEKEKEEAKASADARRTKPRATGSRPKTNSSRKPAARKSQGERKYGNSSSSSSKQGERKFGNSSSKPQARRKQTRRG